MTTIEQTDKSLKKAGGAGDLENCNLPPIRTTTTNSEVPSVKVRFKQLHCSVEFGWLTFFGYPGASTVGSHLPDGDRSHSSSPAMSSHAKGRQPPVCTNFYSIEREGRERRGMAWLMCKGMGVHCC